MFLDNVAVLCILAGFVLATSSRSRRWQRVAAGRAHRSPVAATALTRVPALAVRFVITDRASCPPVRERATLEPAPMEVS